MQENHHVGLIAGVAALTILAGGLARALHSGLEILPDRPLEARLAPGQVQTYRFPLRTGELVRAVVEQLETDVTVTLRSPSGAILATVDSLNGRSRPEVVFAVAREPGDHRLEIAPAAPELPGRYRVTLAEVRAALPADRARVDVLGLFARAEKLRREGGLDAALPLYEQALGQVGDDRDLEEQICYRLGWLHQEMGEPRIALEWFERLLPRWRGRDGEGNLLLRMGCAHLELGDRARAASSFRGALRSPAAARLPDVRATAYLNLAVLAREQGEIQQALDLYGRAWVIRSRHPNPHGLWNITTNVGQLYLLLGRGEQALVALEQAVGHARSADDPQLVLRAERNLARGNLELGRSDQAEALLQRIARVDPDDEVTLNALGEVALERDRPAARARFEQALAAARRHRDELQEGQALANLGYLLGTSGDGEAGLRSLAQAETIYRRRGDRTAVAQVLLGRAEVLRALGDTRGALEQIEESLRLVEEIRAEPRSSALRASFLARRYDAYALRVELWMDLHRADPTAGWDRRALEAAEAARGRTLLESLGGWEGSLAIAVDPALLARERELVRELRRTAEEQMKRAAGARSAAADDSVHRLDARAQDLRQALEAVREEIRHGDPRSADLARPRPLSVGEVQSQVLDEGVLLLVYHLGDERSFLWLVGRDLLISRELPGRAAIERLATAARDEISRPVGRGSGFKAPKAATELSRTILGPVAEQLGNRRLAILPDGVLYYVPFAALPDPASPDGRQPLVRAHEIVVLPSASALLALRRQEAGRRPPPGEIAVLADPVFDSADPRVRAPLRERWGSPVDAGSTLLGDALRSARSLGISRLGRLRHSRTEAAAIARLVPAGRLTALDFAASRATAMGPELGRYRIVHIATHGLFNPRFPALSGLVLSLVDRRGHAQDGFLRAPEIYGLHLPADLVVLSACQTALGENVRGEGLVGMTRGFFYSGASRVMVSLWNVDDRATAELMDRFYSGLWRQGLSPAAALRRAQLELLDADP
jgi:CHAT domain-containing protein/Tfp pilus assembly protein PilF